MLQYIIITDSFSTISIHSLQLPFGGYVMENVLKHRLRFGSFFWRLVVTHTD